MQELEIILEERNENDSGLDRSLLFYSGAMAPLNFKPAPASSNKLDSGSLLDYISEILKPCGVSSSSIKPGLVDKEEIDLVCKAAKEWFKEFAVPSPAIAPKVDYTSELLKPYRVPSSSIKPRPVDWDEINIACKTAKEWSKEFSVPSLPIAPKVEMDYGAKAWEDAIYKLNLSAPSSPLRPGNKPRSHDRSPQNNILSGFYSPSSPINPFKTKASPWKEEKPSFGMPGFEPPKPDFSWLKPAEPIMPDFNMHNSGWGAKQNIKINARSWEQPAFEMPKLPSFEPLRFKMPEADLSPAFELLKKEPLTVIPFSTGEQLHLHEGCNSGNLQRFIPGEKEIKLPLDGYQSAMADYYADKLNLKRKKTSCNTKSIFERYGI